MSQPPLQTVIDSLDAHVAVLDEQGVIVWVNQAWRHFARENGCEEKRVCEGVNYLEVCRESALLRDDALASEVLQGIREVLQANRTSFTLEYPCHSDTQQRWFQLKVRPFSEGHSRVLVIHENISVYREAGEQVRVAAARQQREARVVSSLACSDKLANGALHELAAELTEKAATAIGVARAGVWLLDSTHTQPTHIVTYQAFPQTHTAGASLVGNVLSGLLTSPLDTKCLVIDETAIDPRTRNHTESYFRPNGITSLLAAAVPLVDQRLGIICLEQSGAPHHWESDEIAFASQLADQLALTLANFERQRARTALQFSERHFKALFQEHAAIKLILDPATGRILDANKAASEFYGWPLEQLRRMSIHNINTLPVETVRRAMAEVGSGNRKKFEFRHRLADGSIRDVEAYGHLIVEEGRTILYSIIHDISERKWAEAEREKLAIRNRQLEKTEGLHRMAGAVAHHFNNHLQSVLMSLDLLRPHLGQNAEALECLSAGTVSARRAADLSTLMLTYLGQSFAELETLELGDFCRERLPELLQHVPAGISIAAELPTAALHMAGNRSQMRHLLANLLTNAWEAYPSDAKGEVTLTVKVWRAEDIPTQNRSPLDWQPKGTLYAGIEVSDQGEGIPPHNLDKIFDPFFSTKFHGRGLGLAVVLGIVREERGAICVESAPNLGTKIRVFFPVLEPPATRSGLPS